MDEERDELARLRKAADQFLDEKFKAALQEMDVEILNQDKQKIRVSYLRSTGIQNIWQLSRLSRQQLEALDGIGAQGAAKIYDLHHKALTKEIAVAQKATGGLSWFFATSKEQTAALAAAEALCQRLSGEFGDPAMQQTYQAVSEADITACYAHFRENAAVYYAALEKYCKQLPVTQDSKAGLPEELIAQIEAMELDLSGLNIQAASVVVFCEPQLTPGH